MQNNDFNLSIIVEQSVQQAFNSILNFRDWWSEDIEGHTDIKDEIFFYHYKDIHLCKIKLIEILPNQRIVYEVIENQFSFINDQTEWVGTQLIFEISSSDMGTIVNFNHKGLISDYECFKVCEEAWTGYITISLFNLINTGKGNPNPKDKDGFNAELAKKWKLN